MQKLIADLARETRKGFDRVAKQFGETDRRMRETDQRMRGTDERIEKLVIAMGEVIRQQVASRSGGSIGRAALPHSGRLPRREQRPQMPRPFG